MCYSLKNFKQRRFFVDRRCNPQNIALAITRGEALGLTVTVGDVERDLDLSAKDFCGVMVQYPDTYGEYMILLWCALITMVSCGCAVFKYLLHTVSIIVRLWMKDSSFNSVAWLVDCPRYLHVDAHH